MTRSTSSKLGTVCLIAALTTLLAACGDTGPNEPDVGPAPERVILSNIQWSQDTLVGGTEADTLVAIVGAMAVGPEGLAFSDIPSGRIIRVNPSGQIDWISGREGQGPGEFVRVVDLEFGPDQSVWALDMDNSRVTVLGADGESRKMINLTGVPGSPVGLMPQEDGGAWLLMTAGDERILRIDTLGNVLEAREIQGNVMDTLHHMATQLTMTTDMAADRMIMAFQMGNGLISVDVDENESLYSPYVEAVPFPEIQQTVSGNVTSTGFAERPTFAARAVSHSGERIYVHFSGSSDDRLRLIDIYDSTSLRYEGSWVLPRRVSTAVVHENVVYAEFSDPYPTIVRFTPVR